MRPLTTPSGHAIFLAAIGSPPSPITEPADLLSRRNCPGFSPLRTYPPRTAGTIVRFRPANCIIKTPGRTASSPPVRAPRQTGIFDSRKSSQRPPLRASGDGSTPASTPPQSATAPLSARGGIVRISSGQSGQSGQPPFLCNLFRDQHLERISEVSIGRAFFFLSPFSGHRSIALSTP